MLFDYLGRQCRATPDLASEKLTWSAELKTTRCADPDQFKWDALRLGYHVQKAMQRMAMRANGGKPKEHFIIAAETAKPWPISVLLVEEESLDLGERQMRLWTERLLACEASGIWPPYVQTVVPFKIGEGHTQLEWDGDEDAGDEATP
jgi:hypothetical protein